MEPAPPEALSSPVAPGEAPGALPVLNFAQHHAFIVGIDAYAHVSRLKTAVSDATRLAQVLREQQQFTVHPPLLDASAGDLRRLLHETMKNAVGPQDRVLFYFAGHGIADDGDDGPQGYLVPADGRPSDVSSFVPMTDLRQALQALPCRHLLLIMDCCFSGAFKWSSATRGLGSLMPKRIYKDRFDRFISDPAWQVITSAASDQLALDLLPGGRVTGERGAVMAAEDATLHSPFALALFDGLAGLADARTGALTGDTANEGDGIITATELYAYIRDRVEPETLAAGQRMRQTPGFFPLPRHDKGEFIFLHPRHRRNLPFAPASNPFKGLAAFDEADRLLFYGRDRVVRELHERSRSARLLVVSGASGTGKSSVIKAGLLPLLRAEGHDILEMRPGTDPLASLDAALARRDPSRPSAVLLIDQFEEVITRCPDPARRPPFFARLHALVSDDAPEGRSQSAGTLHRVLITVRSDYEAQIDTGPLRPQWLQGRCTVPPFSLEELKEVVQLPAMQAVLAFEPPELVDQIVEDVVQSPGALPLLSYALSELYEAYRTSGRSDRALTRADYERLGGVMGALRGKADALHDSLRAPQQDMLRKLMLRMVSAEGDLASRRAARDDLSFSPDEDALVEIVIQRLVDARLVVHGGDYIEPAHDALVRAWRKLHDWIHVLGREHLILVARLDPDADAYAATRDAKLLWRDNPNLAVASKALASGKHVFNAKDVAFIRASVSSNRRRRNILLWSGALASLALLITTVWAVNERHTAELRLQAAEEAKARTMRGLFSGLSLSMWDGQPGSVCVYGLCEEAPEGDGDRGAWSSLGNLPDDLPLYQEGEPQTRVFTAAREYHDGFVLVYAQDALTTDGEIQPGSDNLLFAENALRWLTSLYRQEGCDDSTTTVLLWPGTFADEYTMAQAMDLIDKRGWNLQLTAQATLEADLRCADVVWYLSDWHPPADFASHHVPMLEGFVRAGGGLLVGGLGWSHSQERPLQAYAANVLGQAFGFAFTDDAFVSEEDTLITLDVNR